MEFHDKNNIWKKMGVIRYQDKISHFPHLTGHFAESLGVFSLVEDDNREWLMGQMLCE